MSDIIYGVAENGIDNSPNTKDGDPAGAPEPNKLTFEPTFDISTIEAQQMVQEQLDDLVTYTTPEGTLLFCTAFLLQNLSYNEGVRVSYLHTVSFATRPSGM